MVARYLPAGLTLIGLLLLAGAIVAYCVDGESARVSIDEPERDLVEAVAGREVEISFLLRNPTWHKARVVGLAEC